MLFLFVFLSIPLTAAAEFISDETLLSGLENEPYYLRDRGQGVPSSMFGTYVTKSQLLFYPFYEYYYDSDMEYSPDEFGYDTVHDYRGKFRGHEGLIFVGYGVTDWLMVEMEAAVISASVEKADDDVSTMPAKLEESGLGDVEGQVRWRWMTENKRRPELFSYFETVFPLQKDKVLIGTQDWEYKLGFGATKGFSFGTLTIRFATEYDRGEDKTAPGEYAVEYLKKISSRLRIYGGMEGSDDEIEVLAEAQVHLNRHTFLKFNSGFGATSKATDWAPEIGMVFSF